MFLRKAYHNIKGVCEEENKLKAIRVFFKLVFSRTMLCILMILLQVLLIFAGITWLESVNQYIYIGLMFFSVIIIIVIFNSDEPSEFKITWIALCGLDPFLGVLMYNFAKLNWENRRLMNHLNKNVMKTMDLCKTDEKTKLRLVEKNRNYRQIVNYVEKTNFYGLYENTDVVYYPSGEKMFSSLMEELEKAKKFIFMEYFIIDKGYVWSSILDVLKRKVQEGVEVRVLYDGMCSLFLLPYSYPKQLAEYGIKAKMFSPIKPLLSTSYNFRDHRKIVSIDGKVAFTGGLNLADEYINKKERFGYWKDVGIKLEGDATNGFTNMFLQMWNYPEQLEEDYSNYVEIEPRSILSQQKGFVLPYGDGPHMKEKIGRNVYLDMINKAREYVHIMTPYLILDDELENALKFAAKKGVDIRIIMPHIPDKRTIFAVGRTFYPTLLDAGVKIYEFTPGFCHGKYFVVDDTMASVGSINLDFRSLYLHFECSALFYDNQAVYDVERDFIDTLKICEEITLDRYKKFSAVQKLSGRILRIVAPLL